MTGLSGLAGNGATDSTDVWLETEQEIVRGDTIIGAAYASTGRQSLRVTPSGRYSFPAKPYVYGASLVSHRPVSRNS